jgi:hypothetical protein
LANSGQWFTLIAAVVASYLGLRAKALPQVVEEATAWVDATTAFVYAALLWAFVSLLRAPFVVVKADREGGAWHGRQYIYHRPRLVAVIRCDANSSGEQVDYPVTFDDAEEGAFAHYSLEFERNVSAVASASIGGLLRFAMPEPGKSSAHPAKEKTTGGIALGKGREAVLSVKMKPNASSVTARLYCTDFCMPPLERHYV